MAQADSSITTDLPGAPTPEQMDAMWLARRQAEQDEADRAEYERFRRSVQSVFVEKAAEDEIKYGEAA